VLALEALNRSVGGYVHNCIKGPVVGRVASSPVVLLCWW
jgi:hypothetical protein